MGRVKGSGFVRPSWIGLFAFILSLLVALNAGLPGHALCELGEVQPIPFFRF
jgi:hypothetical protein